MATFGDDGYPMVELDSDVERGEDSSEDEIEIILHGTPEQKRRLRRNSTGKKSSSEDEFEKEMNAELNLTVKCFQQQQQLQNSAHTEETAKSSSSNCNKGASDKCYDKVYFDSDDDDDEEETTSASEVKRTSGKHKILSHDELLYDPDSDDENQKWIDGQRKCYQPKSVDMQSSAKSQTKRLPSSDAVLNCPACMTLLCLDCQRHAKYNNQYRAMFVKNCLVDNTENLKYPIMEQKRKSKKKKQKHSESTVSDLATLEQDAEQAMAEDSASGDGEIYHPVKCSVCRTEVGVIDKDEIFHFFNVLSSYT